jgi:hypothetical protein
VNVHIIHEQEANEMISSKPYPNNGALIRSAIPYIYKQIKSIAANINKQGRETMEIETHTKQKRKDKNLYS